MSGISPGHTPRHDVVVYSHSHQRIRSIRVGANPTIRLIPRDLGTVTLPSRVGIRRETTTSGSESTVRDRPGAGDGAPLSKSDSEATRLAGKPHVLSTWSHRPRLERVDFDRPPPREALARARPACRAFPTLAARVAASFALDTAVASSHTCRTTRPCGRGARRHAGAAHRRLSPARASRGVQPWRSR